MLTIGLTGNAGSGKSTVADVWRGRGVEIVDADQLARELLDEDRHLRRALAVEFGDEILEPSAGAETGPVRRAELARRAFASPERTRALNRLVHPPLLALLEERLAEIRRRNGGPVAIDAALIFELGVERLLDVIVLVTAPLELRLERLRRRGLDEGTIRGLVASQIPEEDKAAGADHVVRNDDSLDDLRSAAADVLERILDSPFRSSRAASGTP